MTNIGQEYYLDFAEHAHPDAQTVLDVGCGDGNLSRYMIAQGYSVLGIDKIEPDIDSALWNYRYGLLEDWWPFVGKFDIVLASHVLEHIQDTGVALGHLRNCMKDDGWLLVIVPPFKHEIVGGHVHVFNMGLLMYNLILAGFDVKHGHFCKHGYNIGAYVQKSNDRLPDISYDSGDIEKLKDFWPERKPAFTQGFHGDLQKVNWFE